MMLVIRGAPHLPVIGGTPAEEVLKELTQFSQKKENWYNDPNKSAEAAKTSTDPRPEGGHHAVHARHITVPDAIGGEETYHVSFTITQGQMALKSEPDKLKDKLFRHATIGVGDMTRLVDPIEAFTVLKYLGFKDTGALSTIHPDFPAVVFIEPLTDEEEILLRDERTPCNHLCTDRCQGDDH